MKRFLLAVFTIFMYASGNAQAVVINSPASIAGVYNFSAATFGADLTTDIWCDDLVLADPLLACDDLLNASAINGKIAVINRGTCNFSLKCLKAQEAGAKAVIVFNHTAGAGTFGMGTTDVGVPITIPCVMLSFEDGIIIQAAVSLGLVNACIGNIKFDNDLSTNSRAGIFHAPIGCIPQSQIKVEEDMIVFPGASATNIGRHRAENVKVNAKINRTPINGGASTQIYDKTSTVDFDIEIDSTATIVLEEFSLKDQPVGKYSINYTITSDSTEESFRNNLAVAEFYLTDNIYCKGRWNAATNAPVTTIGYTRSGGGVIEFLSGYNIKYGKGGRLDSLICNISINATSTLASAIVEAYLYGWVDANGDGGITNDEISYLSTASNTFSDNETRTSVMVRFWLEDFNNAGQSYVIPDDNMYFFTGVRYSGSDLVFLGFDEGMDYTLLNNLYSDLGVLTDFDLPYIGVNQYDASSGVPDFANAFLFTGVRGATAQALIVSGDAFIVANNNELNDQEAQVSIYPNPTSQKLTVSLTLQEPTKLVVYTIMDQNGKIIFQEGDQTGVKDYRTNFNVSNIPNGQYLLHIRTDNGSKQVNFQVLK